MFGIGPQELNVAIQLMKRAPLEGNEAKAVAVTLDKFEKALTAMTQPPSPVTEDEDGDDAESAE